MLPPEIPKPGDVIRADFMRRLIEWIKHDVIPRGDGTTITVSGNIVQTISRPVDDVSAANYTGMFLVIKDNENKNCIKVVCGYDTKSNIAGQYIHAYIKKDVPVSESIQISESGYVFISITYGNDYEFTYTPEPAENTMQIPLAYIVFESDEIKAIHQIQHGPLYTPGVI